MKVIIGKTAGFCFGVKRAVEGSLNQIKDNKKVYCLGELVHNKQVIQKINEKGIDVIDNLSEAKEKKAKIIVRAHGIDKQTYKMAEEKQIEIIDYTCPFVLKVHKYAEEYSTKGYYILLIGSKKHPEIKGTASYCGNHYNIIENEDEIDEIITNINNSGWKQILVISQTTFGIEKFTKMLKQLKKKLNKDILLEVKNTICNATKLRQDEANDISKKVQCMVIVGGKNSSNTKKLYDVSIRNCKSTFLVEDETEIDINSLKKYEVIGIMAGTSTPYESIEKIEKLLKNV